ncbi:MAG: zinc ribbon domain-containing protein [Cellulosilyticaceae bacterium]
MLIGLGIYLIIGIMILAVQIIVGVLVYKNAEQYGLSGVMWMIIVIILPGLVGAILYFIIRYGKEKILYCSHCHEQVKETYNFCPNCRSSFGSLCDSCNNLSGKYDKFCPFCANEMTEGKYNIADKVGAEKGVGIPIVILISLIVGIILFGVIGKQVIGVMQQNLEQKMIHEQLNGITGTSQNTEYKEVNESVDRKTGKERKILVSGNDENTIQAQFNIKEGTALMTIKRIDGEVIYEKKYVDAQIEKIPVKVKKNEQLEVTIVFDKCKGNYKISFIE